MGDTVEDFVMTLPDFLTQAPDGEIRLAGHRIGLFHIIHYYNEGHAPEMLVGQYPTLPLALVHKIIAWYLENQTEADQYFIACAAQMARQRDASQKSLDIALLRRRLEKQRRAVDGTVAESACQHI
jgi:uncharacterized protein (DUF433 family)